MLSWHVYHKYSSVLFSWLILQLDDERQLTLRPKVAKSIWEAWSLLTSQHMECCISARSTSQDLESVASTSRRVGISGISNMPASIVDAKPDDFETVLKVRSCAMCVSPVVSL